MVTVEGIGSSTLLFELRKLLWCTARCLTKKMFSKSRDSEQNSTWLLLAEWLAEEAGAGGGLSSLARGGKSSRARVGQNGTTVRARGYARSLHNFASTPPRNYHRSCSTPNAYWLKPLGRQKPHLAMAQCRIRTIRYLKFQRMRHGSFPTIAVRSPMRASRNEIPAQWEIAVAGCCRITYRNPLVHNHKQLVH